MTWTRNSTVNNITVPYATAAGNADTVDSKHASDFAAADHTHKFLKHVAKAQDECIPEEYDSMQSFRCSSSTTGYGDGYILAWRWANGGYVTQLYTEVDPYYALYYRYRTLNNEWGSWKRIPMGDGEGASGTWSINVTGSAGSLSTVSKSVWGQTYWNSNGVPISISSTQDLYVNTIRDASSNYCYASDGSGNLYLGTTAFAHIISLRTTTTGNELYITSDGKIGIGKTDPSVKLDVNGDTIIGNKSKFYQRGTRGAVHYEIVGDDCDYGVMKIRHTSTEGSGGPGTYTATLTVQDERANNLSGTYEPTFYVKRTGATTTPDLVGVNNTSGRVFTIKTDGTAYIGSNLIIHAGNYTDYTVTKTGGGASGTWGISITGSAGSVPWTGVTSQMHGGNEFNIIDYNYAYDSMWFNYLPRSKRSNNPTAIDSYYFGNGATGYANLRGAGFIKSNSDDTYFLTGGGGHVARSNYAAASHTHDYAPSNHTHKYLKHDGKSENECIPEVYDAMQSFRCTTSSTGFSDGYILAWRWSSGGYVTQLYTEVDPYYALYYRYRNNSSEWGAWKRIPMGDGTGASGTWGISITGAAGSVPWSGITGKPTSKSMWGRTYVDSNGDFSSIDGRMTITGAANGNSNDKWLLKVIQGSDIGSGSYDTVVFTSNDVCSLRIAESDGTQLGLCGGDSHCTFTSTHDFRFYTGCTANGMIYSGSGGTLQLGLNYGGYSVYMNGSSYVAGNITATHFYESSDITLKTNFSKISTTIEQISNLPVFDFSWKKDLTSRNSGTSAQAVQQILPNLVTSSGEDHHLNLDYSVLGTISGILAAREIVKLKEEIRQLKKRLGLIDEKEIDS